MARFPSDLENKFVKNIGGLVLYAAFNPIIDFNMLQFTSSNVLQVTNSHEVSHYCNNLLAGLVVDYRSHITLKDQSKLCIPFPNKCFEVGKIQKT